MERRRLLTALAAAAGGLAGCGGGGGDGGGTDAPGGTEATPSPTPTATPQAVVFPDYRFEEGEDGNSVVVLTVRNRGETVRDRTLSVVIQGPDGQDHERRVDVSLDPGERSTYRVGFPVEWSWFRDHVNLQHISIGT
ncbi:MAG: hypothetical protein ABEJ89_05525 [Haloarculaceae archaeon]